METLSHDSKAFLERGFALVVTLSLMILLTLIAVGLLGLSAVSLRSSSQGNAQAEAQANARLGLMIALGELQKEMGPDMRVSAESALFDQNKDTEAIDGVAQSHWLASYDAWGDWLNASYTPPGKPSTSIGNTYSLGRVYYNDSGRKKGMFRRWLLSLPTGDETNIDAPNSLPGMSDPNWVVLAGKGSLGIDPDKPKPGDELDKVTRAYLTKVGKTGKHAWWISPENHKARIDKAKRPRSLEVDEWETAQGDTAEVGVGALKGFEVLDDGKTPGEKLITTQTLRPALVAGTDMQKHFFDLTAHSQGVLASVRTGHLKKDLSLLFENDNAKLPAPYKFDSGATQEPSIRPMSPELKDRPQIKNRHFASWTNMRHYYRMYREVSDGSETSPGGTEGYGSLKWPGAKPVTDFVAKAKVGTTNPSDWNGSNNYWRFPVLAKLTFIYSLLSRQSSTSTPENTRYELYLVYTPVFTYWNPYNVELRIPNNQFGMMSSGYRVLPFRGRFYLGNTEDTLTTVAGNTQSATQGVVNVRSFLDSGGSGEIIFKPGELRIFSHSYVGANSGNEKLVPGFDPRAIGGELRRIGRNANTTYSETENPGLVLEFSNSQLHGNHQYGNTPGSLSHNPDWDVEGAGRIPLMYMHDWFQVRQTYTPITPPATTNPGNIQRWDLKSPDPLPIGFAQLVIKGLTDLDYESIPPSNPAPNNWAKDWRCRNWIQAPPSYFGSMTYLSEDPVIAHTQRLDSPYVMFFGPMRQGEYPKVVPQLGNNSALGSGAAQPVEQVASASVLELPTAPVSNLAGFSTMRISPGWANLSQTYPHLQIPIQGGPGVNTGQTSFFAAEVKATAYQSGITGPGIGDSFMHPMLPRGDVYKDYDNSKSWDPRNRQIADDPDQCNKNETLVFRDYWDHTFLINDALWDDYFVSSLADQIRPGASAALSLSKNLERFVAGDDISNTRYRYHTTGKPSDDVKAEFMDNNGKLTVDGYLKAAKHLMVDGMFNVNSTSVAAWKALFAGIRERQAVYRDSNGALMSIKTPAGKIAITRFNTEVTDQEMDDPEEGVTMPGGLPGWSGVRFLDDDQLQKLAEECVKQVKQRGPFLNFSEFINRRLSNDQLGIMGALQSAIDYDDKNLDSKSINYRFKSGRDYMLEKSQLGDHGFSTPEAAEGSRFAGIPGYVIQSDLLKPIANTLAVRDDTFRIRAYGESLDATGKVVMARAWCEAVVQRVPEYQDPSNEADVAARQIIISSDPKKNGTFEDNSNLSASNRRFGRKFRIESFRWLNASEV